MGVSSRTLMTWESSQKRWRKMYKGKLYTVSCAALGTLGTKESSYREANEWWKQKQAELDATQPEKPSWGGILEKIEFRRDWCRRNNRSEEAALWDQRIQDLLSHDESEDIDAARYLLSPDIDTRIKAIEAYGGSVWLDIDPLSAEYQIGDGRVWHEREQVQNARESLPRDKTIGGLARRYLDGFALRMRAGNLSQGEYALLDRCVVYFADWIGRDNPPSAITPTVWEDYWRYLLGKTTAETDRFSAVYAEKYFKYARRFIRWLSDLGIHPAPSNLSSKAYQFDTHNRKIETFTVEEAVKLVARAPGQLEVHLLLMLNCGFTQSDISDLLKTEVDLKAGTITRQRGKTRKRHGETVPTVTWRLWPATLELLRKYYNRDHPTLALTTETGKPWVERGFDTAKGKATSRDGIQSNFRHVKKATGIDKPLKLFRKTSSSMLDHHSEFALYAQFFLGHAPQSVAESKYIQPSQERFDKAVQWIGWKYGFAEKPTKV